MRYFRDKNSFVYLKGLGLALVYRSRYRYINRSENEVVGEPGAKGVIEWHGAMA